jgi:hypothetical protein
MTERRQRTEVEKLAMAIARGSYVPRTHVPMKQTPRVKERERRRHVAQVLTRFPVRHGSETAYVLPFEELHRVVGAEVIDAVVEHADDAGVPEAGQHLILALERPDHRFGGDPFGAEPLQRARFPGSVVEHSEHDAHPTRGELLLDGIAARRE